MSGGPHRLVLTEWSVWPPGGEGGLDPALLDDSPEGRALLEGLGARQMLHVRVLPTGVRLETTSFVGTLQLGQLQVVIQPKLEGAPLVALLRYAFGLRHLTLLPEAAHGTSPTALEELLVHQLLAEARELLHHGLHRGYVRRDEELPSPRGRIDPAQWMRHQDAGRTTVRCSHHPRLEDCPLNQVLRAGLRHAARLTREPALRTALHRLDTRLGAITPIRLEPARVRRALEGLDRRVAAYRPALALLQLLLEGEGASSAAEASPVPLPGFLFDMNRFFQALLSRFLQEHLRGWTLRDEHSLRGMLRYVPGHNPLRRRDPLPRPDFALLEGSRVLALLDAKYRDLWETPLPREMLYQVALYALSQGPSGRAVILHPTLSAEAGEQIIELRDAVRDTGGAHVILRPVHLHRLAALVGPEEDAASRREREAHARWLVLGNAAPD